jgi:hypothetical protein
MKKLTTTLGALCVAVVMAAAPSATADIVYTPISPNTYGFGIGLYDPANPFSLNSVYVTSGNFPGTSDSFVFTFAAHMVSIFYNVESLHFNFVYDNRLIEVVGARPVHPPGTPPWVFNNYDDFQWPNPSGGIVSVSTLFQSMGAGTTFMPMNTTSIVPFFQVTLHLKQAPPSQVAFFGITRMTLVSHTFALTLTPASFNYFNGAIHAGIPAPATLWLFAAAMSGLGGGVVRGRRRKA